MKINYFSKEGNCIAKHYLWRENPKNQWGLSELH